MVDSIGAKPIASSDLRSIAAVGAATRAQASEQAADRTAVGGKTASLAETVRTMAAVPPVDADRVARIRRAVQDGSFPISPATIADRMLAFKLNWKPNDPA